MVGSNSALNVSGGSIGDDFQLGAKAVGNIAGGSFGNDFTAGDISELNLSGGSFSDGFRLVGEAQLNIFASAFTLDGEPVAEVALGQPFEVLDRDVTLAGLLNDGSAFSFDLNSSDLGDGSDLFSPSATLFLNLDALSGLAAVPTPTALALAFLVTPALITGRRKLDA